ncbi:acetate--CoA ligase [Patescibacteria group bacterium]|nr:acetate--CoA ligase [Patescibacteria group bacterium]
MTDKTIYKKASKDPIKFWEELAEDIFWNKKWTKAFNHEPPYFQWFVDGKLNITQSCLDQHLPENKDKVALIWEPESIEEEPKLITYGQLFAQVCSFGNALKKLGVKKGDRVVIYMPMIPESVVAMLACARIGAVHSVVFSAFSSHALKARLEDTEAKVLITADGYYRRGQVIDLKSAADQGIIDTKIEKVIVVKRAGNDIVWENIDLWWHEIIEKENDDCPAEIMDSEDPLFILYTSGSTGKPKGILHTCGGYTVQAKATGKLIFNLKADDIFWCTADIGWVTGHTYAVYSALLNNITTLFFEGAPDWPTNDRWAKTIEKHKVTVFYTAPTAVRMFQKYGEEELKEEDLSSLRLLGSVGEPIDEAAWQWFSDNVGGGKCEIVDTWWQTETGGILISSLSGVGPFKPTFTGLAFPGIKVDILNDKGESCSVDEHGNLVILPPFAPGMLRGVYNNDDKYRQTYWQDYGQNIYFTSDAALKDKDGLIRVLGRVDDVLKIAGHRLSTGEMESAVNGHELIGECAVIGIPDPIKGEAIVVFVVIEKKAASTEDELKQAAISQLKKEIGPIAIPKQVYIVEDLPKTRSGKIMRRILKKLFTGEELGDLSTLANPEIVEKISKLVSNEMNKFDSSEFKNKING